MRNHVLVDLETLSTQHNAAIISIGAVRFDSNGMYDTFYTNVDPLDSVQKGATTEVNTMNWWKKQPENIQKALLVDPVTLDIATTKFEEWFRKVPNSYIWGHGPSFDCSILEDSFKLCGKRSPWPYNKEICVRTILQFDPDNKFRKERSEKHPLHHALFDAVYEATHLLAVLNHLNLKLP